MHVTVCIPTRDRGASMARTLKSLAVSHHTDFDVLIVDQSIADDTEEAVHAATAGDSRFCYIRSQARGSSVARNIAIARACGPIVAFTDDDCEVSTDWLTILTQRFEQYPDVGQINGAVHAAPYDAAAGLIPVHIVRRRERIRSPWLKWRDCGIAANMAFRQEVLHAVGSFDDALGAGGQFLASGDYDLTYRVLKAGYAVLLEPDANVVHYGFRSWKQAETLMRRAGFGIGATYMKHLRLGDMAVAPTLIIGLLGPINWRRVLLLQRHSGLGYARAYVQGMLLSLRCPVDRRRRIYSTTGNPR